MVAVTPLCTYQDTEPSLHANLYSLQEGIGQDSAEYGFESHPSPRQPLSRAHATKNMVGHSCSVGGVATIAVSSRRHRVLRHGDNAITH